MPVVCRSSAQPQLPWQHFLEFLKLPGLKQPNSLLQKYLNMSSHGKCGLVASSSPAIPGLSEGVKDHFFGFDKDFGGPPASQEWDLWLWSSPLPNHQRRAALWEGEANPLNPHKAPMVCLLGWIKGLIIRGGMGRVGIKAGQLMK